MKKIICQSLIASSFLLTSIADACTRAVYIGKNEVMTARSMDWKSDVGTNIWILPNKVTRHGVAGPNSIKWTSKYGSVIASGYDISSTDGVNERDSQQTYSG